MKSCLFYSRIVFLFAFLAKVSCCYSTSYYFSNSGNDNNSGTSPGQAWKSLSKIVSINFAPGDSVLLEGGTTLNGNIVFNNVTISTASDPIVFSSYGNGRATISSGTSTGFFAGNSCGFIIKNLNFTGSGYTMGTASGIYFRNTLPTGTKLSFVNLDSVECSGYNNVGIGWSGVNAGSGFCNIRITHAKLHDNGNGMVSAGINGVTGNRITNWAHCNTYIAYCEAYNNPGSPQVTNNQTGDGIQIRSTDGLMIEHCIAYNNGSGNQTTSGGPVGIWCTQTNNAVIQYCESHHNHHGTGGDGDGFDLDGAVTNGVLQYNYSHDNDGAGFLIYQFNSAAKMDSVTIRYNISVNDSRLSSMGGVQVNSNDVATGGGVNNAEVYNNTVYLTPNNVSSPPAFYVDGKVFSLEIANNIIQITGGLQLLSNSQPVVSQFLGNNYWCSGSQFKIKWNGIYYNQFSDWQAASGQEKYNDTTTAMLFDPLLLNPNQYPTINNTDSMDVILKNYFTLQKNSPAIDAAFPDSVFGLQRMQTDFFGVTIPRYGKLDIGASEHDDSSSVSVNPIPADNDSYGSLLVFPNPANQQLTLSFNVPSSSNIIISIFDLIGQELVHNIIKNEGGGKISVIVNTAKIKNGIYYLKLQSGNRQFLRKICVNR